MWREIYDTTDCFLAPRVIPSIPSMFLTVDDLSSIFQGVKNDSLPGKINYFRGYENGCEDYTLAEQFLDNDFQNIPLSHTITSFFGSSAALKKKTGMVINGGLQWSSTIQQIFSIEAKKLNEIYNSQLFSVDMTMFIGAYGQTPFGVHVDDTSHRTILFNLGPGNKGVLLWKNAEIEAQFGKVLNILDINSITAVPEEFYFSPGQAFVLPSSRYHSGINKDLSITVAIVVDLISNSKAIAREVKFFDELLDASDEQTRQSMNQIKMTDFVDIHNNRSRSNAFLRYSLFSKSHDVNNLKRQSTVSMCKPFSIESYRLPMSDIVFSRGKHRLLPINDRHQNLGDFINSGHCTIMDIVDYLRSDKYSVKDALCLIQFLTDTHSIVVH